jgi:hypothetical protein
VHAAGLVHGSCRGALNPVECAATKAHTADAAWIGPALLTLTHLAFTLPFPPPHTTHPTLDKIAAVQVPVCVPKDNSHRASGPAAQ